MVNCRSLSAVDSLTGRVLVEEMIQHNPEQRPAADYVTGHVIFWTAEKKLKLIQGSRYLTLLCRAMLPFQNNGPATDRSNENEIVAGTLR